MDNYMGYLFSIVGFGLNVDSCHDDPPFLGVDPPAKQVIYVRAI